MFKSIDTNDDGYLRLDEVTEFFGDVKHEADVIDCFR
jgi:hypothetical protein